MPNSTIPGVSCTVLLSPVTPGTSSMMPFQLLAAGVLATSSPLRTCWRAAFCTSTMGVSPVTVIVSSSVPTFMSALSCTVPEPASSMPSRLTTLKPVKRERDRVGAGPQIDDLVLPARIGGDRPDLLDQRRAGGFNRHSR